MCHLTAMEGRGKGREELGVEEAFAFVLAFRVRVDGQVVLPHPAGRSTNKLFPIVSQRQTNDCGALSVSRPLSLSRLLRYKQREGETAIMEWGLEGQGMSLRDPLLLLLLCR